MLETIEDAIDKDLALEIEKVTTSFPDGNPIGWMIRIANHLTKLGYKKIDQ